MYTRKFLVVKIAVVFLALLLPMQSISNVSSAPASDVIEFVEHVIDSNFEYAYLAYAADLDGDDDLDVFGVSHSQVAWWENDGNQNFSRHLISSNLSQINALQAADLDSDGDPDILAAVYWEAGILWLENNGAGSFTEHWVDDKFNWAFSVFAIDLDSDSDVDVLGASMDSSDVAWWENDGNESFTKHIVDDDFQSASDVYGIDLDGDQDIDIIASGLDDRVVWFENDGSENFTSHRIQPYSSNVESIHCVLPTDLDNDGDIDVLGTDWQLGSSIAWWINDGTNTFTDEDLIFAGGQGAIAVDVADIDGDGLLDVLGAGGVTSWMQNDGSRDFTRHVIDNNEASSVYAADLDGDGDLDILTVGAAVTWWEHIGYELAFLPLALSVAEPPSSAPVINPIANLDGDGNYTVSWSTVVRATSYTLEEDSQVDFSSPRVAYSGPDTSESITGKGLGTYYYRVQASGGLGSSDWSKTKSVDVTVEPTPIPGPDEGDWSGTTNQGLSIIFTVDGDTVYDLTIKYMVVCPSGIMVKTKTFDEFATISNDTFEFDADGDPTVAGEFTSNSHASGTWSSSFQVCQGSGTWSADGP